MPDYDVVLVGSGFCGTMAAVTLAHLSPTAKIALIERNDIPGPGLAYGTSDADHLLNVRAEQMGAFADAPGDFWCWLEMSGQQGSFGRRDFVPRRLYGAYLRHLLQEACAASPSLTLLKRRITGLQRTPVGFTLTADDGSSLMARKVVLALGNFPPEQAERAPAQNPYAPQTAEELADDGDILIVGTGLTSLDMVATLARTKKTGHIHLLSRHGLLPREHADTASYTLSLQADNLPRTALALCRIVRGEITSAAALGVSWRSVIDALRPLNQSLWQALPTVEKRRFLRHLRAYWDVHRHRCAPQIMDGYRALEQAGRLTLHYGPILSQTRTDNGWRVTWRPRGTTEAKSFDVRHILRCTGPQADFRKLDDPLIQNMLQSGLVAADALQLGLATAEDYTVLDAKGARVEGLYALGSVLKGRLYESVAVPELREQAAAVARNLAT